MADEEQSAAQTGEEKSLIQAQKIYLKDVSFETPNSPQIFTREWKPKLAVEINNQTATIADDLYEVVLMLTATVKADEQTAFLAEVHQAGIFVMKGFESERLHRVQNVFCMQMLYPYASAALTDLVSRGGFPQLLLQPMNFEGIYAQRQQAVQDNAGTADSPPH
jgi:preprotein translocase subunit SecB